MANDPTDANEPTDTGERHVTRDREQIRSWAEGRDAVPVTVMGGEAAEPEYTFVRRSDLEAGQEYEERSWDEFFETFEEGDMVFVYREEEPTGEDLGYFELVARTEVMDRAGLEPDEVEEALLAGETVTTELTETRVIEREIVETDTIESELIDSDVVERDVVASEVIDRDVLDVEFVDGDTIDVTVDEHRMDTIEEIEHLTVESKIVDIDVDVEAHDQTEVDQLETSIADETIHRAILESDVTRGNVDVDEMLDQGRIRTDREGESIESQLIERRTVEEEVRDRRRMTFVLEGSEIVETEVMAGEVIEAELVDVDEYAGMAGGTIGAAAGAETGAGSEASGMSAPGETEPAAGAEMDTRTGVESEADPGTDTEATARAGAGGPSGSATPIEPTEDDQGKNVVDATGEHVGIVADVEGETVYIDPEPGFVDRLKARFNWGEPDRDAYPVNASQVREITDDEIVLESE